MVPVVHAFRKMEGLKEEDRRKLVVHFYESNQEYGTLFTVRHFMKMGISRSTLCGHMMREEQLKEEQGVEEKL